jgi:ArsR family transcriptional regulator
MNTQQLRASGIRCCDSGAQASIEVDEAERLSDALQLLTHPVRIQILDILTHYAGQACVCDLEAALPVKQPTVSHHLKILRDAGLIDCERQGLWAYYTVRHDRLAQLQDRIKYLFDTLTSQD